MRNVVCLLLSMLFVTSAQAATATIPNTFTAGTTSSAAQVNANFTAIKTAVDDNNTRITALEACPAGFTDVSAAGNQLGCMQTAEQVTAATWEMASDTCFKTYGGRLPTSGEWYITMNNFVLTAETDNWEWNNDALFTTLGDRHAMSGLTLNSSTDASGDTAVLAYRCWIPR